MRYDYIVSISTVNRHISPFVKFKVGCKNENAKTVFKGNCVEEISGVCFHLNPFECRSLVQVHHSRCQFIKHFSQNHVPCVPVTTAGRVLKLRMEETASRYGR